MPDDTGEQETNLKFAKNWNIFCLKCLFAANFLTVACMLAYFISTMIPPDSPSATEALAR